MSTINKFFPINVQNTNSITGTYGNVSLLVNANEETKGTSVLKQVAINQNIDPSCNLAVNGDTKLIGRTDVSGSLYVNGTQITGSGGGGTVGPDLSLNTLTIGNDVSGSIFLNGDVNIKALNYSKKLLIDADLDISRNTIFRNNLDSYGNTYVEKLTYSNLSSDISILNWDASIPTYGSNGAYVNTYYGLTTDVSGWTFDSVLSNEYIAGILKGLFNATYYVTYFPVASNQAFILNPSDAVIAFMTSKTYNLVKGQYLFGFYTQCSNNGAGGLVIDASIKDASGNIVESITGINPVGIFPNWLFSKISVIIPATANYTIEFRNKAPSYINGAYILITGIELTLQNSIVIQDTTTNETSVLSGGQSTMNNLFINKGLTINDGGINVLGGGINTNTTYGSNNTTINSPLGEISGAVSSADNISMGSGSGQALTTGKRNIFLGIGSNFEATSATDNILIGYNTSTTTTEIQNIVIGNRQNSQGTKTVVIGDNTDNYINAGTIGNFCVAIGAEGMGTQVYNGYGTERKNEYSVSVGWQSQQFTADYYNTSVGTQTLYNIAGSIASGFNTRYNSAFGYQAGIGSYLTRNRYNNCTFLGALTDSTVNNISNSTAIGYNCKVDASNTIQLGSNGERVKISGDLQVSTINGSAPGGSSNLAQVLAIGNKAGTNIDMSSNSIINCTNINTTTINSNTPAYINVENTFTQKQIINAILEPRNINQQGGYNFQQSSGSIISQTGTGTNLLKDTEIKNLLITTGQKFATGINLDMSSNDIQNVKTLGFIDTGELNINTANITNVGTLTLAGTKNINCATGTITNCLQIDTQILNQAQTAITNPDLKLQNTNSSATTGCRMRTTKLRPSAGLSAGDILYEMETYGTNSANTLVQYAEDILTAFTTTAGAHEGRRKIQLAKAGVLTDILELGVNTSLMSSSLRMNNIGFQQGYKSVNLTANTNLSSTWYEFAGTEMFVNQTTNGWTLTIGASTTYSGGVYAINNESAFNLTLSSSSGNFGGSYGTGTTSIIVYPRQTLVIVGNNTEWSVSRVFGVPYVMRYYTVTNQSIANNVGAGTLVQLPTLDTDDVTLTTGIHSWSGKQLTYYPTAGTNPQYSFGNNTGFTMTVRVEVQLSFAANATGVRAVWLNVVNGTGAATVARYRRHTNMMYGNTATFPGGVGYVRAEATLTLGNNDAVLIYAFQNSGAALSINSATAANRANITFTRIG